MRAVITVVGALLMGCHSPAPPDEATVSSAVFSTLLLSTFTYSDDHIDCPERPVHMKWSSADGERFVAIWTPASEGSYGVKDSTVALCGNVCPAPSRIGVSIDVGGGLVFGDRRCGQRCYDPVCDGTVTLDANWIERSARVSLRATLPLGDHLEGNRSVANPPASVEAHGSAAK